MKYRALVPPLLFSFLMTVACTDVSSGEPPQALIERGKQAVVVCMREMEQRALKLDVSKVSNAYLYISQMNRGASIIIFTHGELGSFAERSVHFVYMWQCVPKSGQVVYLSERGIPGKVLIQDIDLDSIIDDLEKNRESEFEIKFEKRDGDFYYCCSQAAKDFEKNFRNYNPNIESKPFSGKIN